jgi:hypothetical protein
MKAISRGSGKATIRRNTKASETVAQQWLGICTTKFFKDNQKLCTCQYVLLREANYLACRKTISQRSVPDPQQMYIQQSLVN